MAIQLEEMPRRAVVVGIERCPGGLHHDGKASHYPRVGCLAPVPKSGEMHGLIPGLKQPMVLLPFSPVHSYQPEAGTRHHL